MNLALCLALLLSTVCILLVLVREIFARFHKLIALLTWLFLLSLLSVISPLTSDVTTFPAVDSVPMTFYAIFVVHAMLPTAGYLVLLLGLLTGLFDIIIIIAFLERPLNLEWRLRPVNNPHQ